MKRDFVFIWSPEVQPAIAALSAPKIAQLRAWCDRLIARAEQCRRNATSLANLVEASGFQDEESPWAPFHKFGYWFKLDYQEARRAYVLNFAEPPGGAETSAPKSNARARASRVRKRARRDAREAMASGIWSALRSAKAALHEGLARGAARSVQLFLRWSAREAARARNSIGVLCDMPMRWRPIARGVFAASSSTPVHGPRVAEAILEPRLIGQNTGIAMLIYTLVWNDEPIDWSADLFGAPESERS